MSNSQISESKHLHHPNWTDIEIKQQPQAWLQVAESVANGDIQQWLSPILARTNLRIVLTGAGTSAYVGDSLAPFLTQQMQRLVESVSTTDMVSNPEQYLLKNTPTLLISYARSGNSPESVAAATLAEQLVDQCFHLVITCNPQGQLANYATQVQQGYSVLMPEQTLDKSFAMTSSFTSMSIASLCLLSPDPFSLKALIHSAQDLIDNKTCDIQALAHQPLKRFIFLGSGAMQGIAREAALKYLELTAGDIDSYCESALGFRHGPKSSVDQHTRILILKDNQAYTAQYDQDMIDELTTDQQALGVHVLTSEDFAGASELQGPWLGLLYIVYCQFLAMYKSLNMGLTPDNPCPTGEVNRVVQGVKIYPYPSTTE